MQKGQKLWTKNELILTINLYAKIPFGKMDHRNNDVKNLALLLNRTPGAIARRLANFASLDPVQQARGIKGLPNAGGLAEKVWFEFYTNWDECFEASEQLLASYKKTTIQDLYEIDDFKIGLGREKFSSVKIRLNQHRFRKIVLANYDSTCCITGLSNPDILIASHITPWSEYENNRLNPANGLCLNALHDKAFDKGLITINAKDFTIRLSPVLKKKVTIGFQEYFIKYEGKEIRLPKKFLPAPEFLKIHNSFFESQAQT